MVTPQDIAARLNNIQYRTPIAQSILEDAKAHGLVIVTGASDDLIEFDGAAVEEYGAYHGDKIKVGIDGEPIFGCEEPCNHCRLVDEWQEAKTEINAQWDEQGYSWFIDINIDPKKYGAFNVMEDDETYCRGIVFALEDIK